MRFPLLARTWDALISRAIGRQQELVGRTRHSPRIGLSILPLEDRITPTTAPLPEPYIFVGTSGGTIGMVKAYHADTGTLAFQVQPFGPDYTGAVNVATGDINHDGTPDLITSAGSGGGPAVKIYDGMTGNLITGPLGSFYAFDPSFTGGVSVASGDVLGDGYADVIVAAGASGGPNIKVFSGRTGELAESFYAFAPSFTGGTSIAVADFTGNGVDNIAVGAGPGGAPNVRVFDASTGQIIGGPLGSFYAFDSSITAGVNIGTNSLAGDVNGDGRADLVAGLGAGVGSEVRVFDGVTGSIAADFSPFGSSMTAGVTISTAYVNADPYADIVVGTGAGVPGEVKVFSGQTFQQLPDPMGSYSPFGSSYTGGLSVAASNDPDASIVYLLTSGSPQVGGTLTLTGQVWDGNSSDGLQQPTGTITFSHYVSGSWVTLGTATLASYASGKSQASLTINPLTWPVGSQGIRANYAGDGWFLSNSTAQYVNVTSPSTLSPPTLHETAPPCSCGGGVVAYGDAAPSNGTLAQAGAVQDNGQVKINLFGGVEGDISSSVSNGLGSGSVDFTNATGYTDSTANYGMGNVQGGQPRLVQVGGGSQVAMIDGGGSALWFNFVTGGTYTTPFGSPVTLVENTSTGELNLTDGSGAVFTFYDFGSGTPAGRAGKFKKRVDSEGNLAQVVSWDSSGRATELQMTDAASGAVESLVSTFDSSGDLTGLTRRREIGGGAWSTVRSATFTYASVSGASGMALVGTTQMDGSGSTLEQTYSRYYASGATTGYAGALKYHLGVAATARLQAAYAGTALSSLTDTQIAPYADNYLEYDPTSHRSTKVVTAGQGCSACSGGLGTSTINYSVNSSPGTGMNAWTSKVAETLTDGTIHVTYANSFGQTILSLTTDPTTSNTWLTYTRYDSTGRVILQANPSAVTGYSESLSDLVGWSGSSATYLSATTGLITTTTYGTSTTATDTTAGDVAGSVKSTWIQQGTSGTPIQQSATTYISRTTGSTVEYHVASSTQFRNTDGTGAQTTSYSYTWYSGSQQMQSMTTILPVVTSTENGPGTAASSTTVFDTLGRSIWSKDAAGVISYTAYDPQTGAVVKSIQDVNTALTSEFTNLPSGWSTPSGAGQNLIATHTVDSLGRTTSTTDPLGNVTYTVYDDVNHAVRTYAGWNSTTNMPTGPTTVTRQDLANGYTETLTMSATPAVSGGQPTGTEAISNIQSLRRSYTNTAGQVIYTDTYFNLGGVTYSTAPNIGTQNVNFYRTQYAYDDQGRQNKTISAAGTITRTVYDSLGRVASTWVGLNDTTTTGYWSPTNTAGSDLVMVTSNVYDGGGVGDSNLTQSTQYPGGSVTPRVTQTWYDWRDRAVATKSGVQSSEGTGVNRPLTYTQYDNLGEAVVSSTYESDGITLTSTSGVPNAPSASILRAQTVTSYDEQGRVYETQQYSVDPTSGAVSAYALTTQNWYDLRGLTIKTSSPGGLVQKTSYDSLGRATVQYTTDGGGDVTWADAGNVTGDTVLSQTEYTYDADSNVILTVDRERMHNATGTGGLGTPTTGVAARASYTAAYYDAINRTTASVDVGTNGGTAWTRPSSVPTSSSTVLVNQVQYNAAGQAWLTTDPMGIQNETFYDLMGRTTKTIENYVNGVVSATHDKTTEYTYGAAGQTSVKVDLVGGGSENTQYVYGVSISTGSTIDSNDIVGITQWPDPTTGAASSSQQQSTTVNALGQTLTATDRNGTTHTLSYDVLGRVTSDAVTTLGTGVDGTIRLITTAYDSQGNAYLVTTYNAVSGGSILTQVQKKYDGLGNLIQEWQSNGSAVNTSTTPSVQYGYSALDANNQVRLISMTYPSGYVLNYNYSSGLNNIISRLSSISDSTGTLEAYAYLGLSTVILRSHPVSGIDFTDIGTGIGDAGDQYVGLDRFGRIVDQKWVSETTGVATDEFTYTYDADGDRLTQGNSVNSAFSETYTYDGLNQLASFSRGTGTRTQTFNYDAAGNRTSVVTNGTTQTYAANAQNEITGVSGSTTPTYDANGNMTTDETGRKFVYDAWNRIVAVKNSSGTVLETYTYDGQGRRVAITASGTTTNLYYSSQWQILEEAVSGVTKARYVWSPVYIDAMILRDRDPGTGSLSERLWVQQDANYDVTALVNGSGSVVERYAYDPYGVATVMNASWTTLGSSAYNWIYLYQGGRLEATSGLYWFRNRDYSATLGRWVAMDPMGYDAGDFNLNRFGANCPTSGTDPSGLDWLPSLGDIPLFPGVSYNRLSSQIDRYKQVGIVISNSDMSTGQKLRTAVLFPIADNAGITNLADAYEGSDAVNSERLTTWERISRGCAGGAQVGLIMYGGMKAGQSAGRNMQLRPTPTISQPALPRVRHHTDFDGLQGIKRDGAIHPSRGEPIGVSVETQPFGSTKPGLNGPKAQTGAAYEGAYVEFDQPGNMLKTNVGPRQTGQIPSETPLPISALNPEFVVVRRWWNLWYFWRN